MKAEPSTWQDTIMEIPSTGEGEDYASLSRFRKWLGDKKFKSLELGKYYKKNEDWETAIAVKRNYIDDDKLGIYNIQAASAGESAGELNDIISDDPKNNAFSEKGIDG
ncbi:Mu-like prophage major head subunit gpT family protein [Candidatus Vondammii sp. HM_W22]|uniref:Mu-like prophage major head subunit gpT family protein n=1 Tax=Candidatus Vondammii sp. HM_W22 TaxID=2687299 RepID=UPI001F128FAF|nr:Mu-like prophage major head subunit gpT family protein [Candidatus Vondammii sp. HM_W22]